MPVNPELSAGWTAQAQNRPAVAKVVRSTPADNVTAVSTADGSDPATTQALANATKAKVNVILTELKDAGLMKTS